MLLTFTTLLYMNKNILLIICTLFTLHVSAQFGGSGKISLQRLGLKSQSLDLVMRDIGAFIAEKPSGLQFPVTKIVFSELDDLLCFEIVGVDNSWKELFKFGEVPYGYTIVQNRLYVVARQGYHKIDLEEIFYPIDEVKSFSKNSFSSPVAERWPVWFFEYKNDEVYLISVSDLDVLDDDQ